MNLTLPRHYGIGKLPSFSAFLVYFQLFGRGQRWDGFLSEMCNYLSNPLVVTTILAVF